MLNCTVRNLRSLTHVVKGKYEFSSLVPVLHVGGLGTLSRAHRVTVPQSKPRGDRLIRYTTN